MASGRERFARPDGELVGIVVEPVGHAPIGHHPAPARLGRVGEGLELLAIERGRGVRTHLQVDHALGDEGEHAAVGKNAGATEQALHLDRPEGRKQFADVVGGHGGEPPPSVKWPRWRV